MSTYHDTQKIELIDIPVGFIFPASEFPELEKFIPTRTALIHVMSTPESDERPSDTVPLETRKYELFSTGPNPPWPVTPNCNLWKRTR